MIRSKIVFIYCNKASTSHKSSTKDLIYARTRIQRVWAGDDRDDLPSLPPPKLFYADMFFFVLIRFNNIAL